MKKDKNTKLIIEQLKETPIVEFACKKTGISRASYYRWRKEDKEFEKETDMAILEGSLLINDLAESQLISAIKDRNLGAIVFWLKNNHKKYASKLEVDASIKQTNQELTPEQENLIKQALHFAGLLAEKENEKENNGSIKQPR